MRKFAVTKPVSPGLVAHHKLDWLQCARALAAISVAGYHAYSRVLKHPGDVDVFGVFRFGNLGVDLFFVISGFIIFHIHAADIGRPERLGRYVYRRLTRIYPLYWILFLLVIPLYFVFPQAGDGTARDVGSIIRCFFLLPNPGGQIIGVAWTLVYEISFYAMFALFILSRRLGLAAFGLWALFVLTARFGGSVDLGFLNHLSGKRFLQFGIGAGVYYLSRSFKPRGGLVMAAAGGAVLFLGGLASAPLAAMLDANGWGHVVFAGILAGLVIFGFVSADAKAPAGAGRANLLVKLGDASYSIYLFHWLVGWVIDEVYSRLGVHTVASETAFFLFTLFAMIAGGYVAHLLLERPLISFFGRWGRRPAADQKMAQRPKLLAVASSGGHWEQLMLLRESFADFDVVYATTLPGLAERSGVGSAIILPDFNAQQPMKTLASLWAVARVVLTVKSAAIVSTGAAPGLVALAVGRVTGKHTIWIDSVANSERLSMCGRLGGKVAHLWLTQWEHLAKPKGPRYAGAVL